MLRFLARRCIPDFQNTAAPKVRQSYGILCGAVGILFNTLLCIAKLLVGILSGSIAITADALNNLSDAGSSAITLFGFRLAAQKPDTEHPFGHGRFEYIAGLIVSLIILLMGIELGKSSVEKILHPAPVAFHWTSVLVLVLSIGVKCYMAAYNRRIGKEIQSATISAAAADSLSDCLSTGAVLLGTLVAHFTGLHIDGWAGLLVAACILFTGYHAAKDTISPLLGQPPAPELVSEIEQTLLRHKGILGVHDLIVHDYGPGRMFVSAHAEVPANGDILALHDSIDNAERELAGKLGCVASIHMTRLRRTTYLPCSLRIRWRPSCTPMMSSSRCTTSAWSPGLRTRMSSLISSSPINTSVRTVRSAAPCGNSSIALTTACTLSFRSTIPIPAYKKKKAAPGGGFSHALASCLLASMM
ncbi:MAG: cation diffusion facilitator family transporter [Christensenellaceae bacterium]